jgi:peptide-methionine (S)-S-oxide reductase
MSKKAGIAKEEIAIFAAGCFWGVEAAFAEVLGVTSTRVGYSGGETANPTYQEVCRGDTGHAEAVKVWFDPAKVSYEELLDVFFSTHDPTQFNRQGPDEGEQYRSAIFYLNEKQKKTAQAAVKKWQKKFKKPIVTEITKAGPFYQAEEYHQKYLQKTGRHVC